MFSWILALPLAAVAWIVAVLYLWLVRRRADETRAGMAALAGLHWRDFSALVRRALEEQRGWRSEPAPQQARAPHADFLMHAEHGSWMVSCKHGRAYRIGAAAVNELGAITRLAGASGGLLVTEGQVEREGLDAAGKQSIEVLDGRRLWPLLKPYLPGDIEDEVVGTARYRAQRHTGIAGLAALALGLLLGLGHRAAAPDLPSAAPATVAAAPASPAVAAPATSSAAPPVSASSPPLPEASDPDPDAATLQRYQRTVSAALARTPGIIRGVWPTRSTLAVDRSGDDAEVWPRICAQLQPYPALRSARVQLNPRPGRDEPVRWRQCSAY